MKLSILTATYNRANLLPKLYESIVINKKFIDSIEWLIMDDGSVDNTKEVVNKWVVENRVEIKYFYQDNQGKMSALNNLSDKINGDLVVEIDSDDFLKEDAFSNLHNDYDKIKENDAIYGLLYLKKMQGDNRSNLFPFDNIVSTLYDLYYKYNYKMFDTAIFFKASIRKQYKYELEDNERFITEAYMYHQMDKKYKGLYLVNKEVLICAYQEDGYTKNIVNIFKKYPKGYYKYFRDLLSFDMRKVLFKKRIYMIKHYILFSTLLKKSFFETVKSANNIGNKILVMFLFIPGRLMTNMKMK